MLRTRLKNKYHKVPSNENKANYKKQRNYCVKLLRSEKRNYFNNLETNVFTDNKKFWKAIKPLFSGKIKSCQNEINLNEDNEIITDSVVVAEVINDYFTKIVDDLNIPPWNSDENSLDENSLKENLNLSEIKQKYALHPSIVQIKNEYKVTEPFSFIELQNEEIQERIANLDRNKATADNDIPAKVLQKTNDIVSNQLTQIYNDSINNHNFPNSLKQADISPVFKKNDKTKKENYRPISILPTISKLIEKILFEQINGYMKKYLSPYLFGFRKGYSTEQCLIVLIEAWKNALDCKKYPGAILTDLSKAFDCLSHNLLIAKLAAYGFDDTALLYIQSFLYQRKQRTKVKHSYSTWKDIKTGVPQGSILGPLLFNIFINDIFLFIKESKIANYADDNTMYTAQSNATELVDILQRDISTLLIWFKVNEMKPNEAKSNLLVSKIDNLSINVGNEVINASKTVNLLDITIDNKLSFKEHVSKICRKASQKFHALARVSKYISNDRLKIIMKAFFDSQFNYCPLVWMFHSRTLNSKINRLHERTLRLVYKNENLDFQELLDLNGSVTIHHRNLQKLATVMYKVKNEISPLPIQQLFSEFKPPYNLRNQRVWETSNINTTYYGEASMIYLGPKTWEILPATIKSSKSLREFKMKVKHWKPVGCICRLCKIYIANVGFL